MVKKVVFWGAAGQARVLRELVSHLGYELVALFDNSPKVPSPFADVPIYHGIEGFAQWQTGNSEGNESFLVAIGGSRGRDRVEIHQFLEANQLRPITAIHPTAFVAANAHLASGCQILAHATVCVDVRMGQDCIVNTAASVDHESVFGKGVHLAPGAVVTGCVTVGDYSFIGARAVVLPRVNIGANVIIGAGSVVNKDVPDGMMTFGNPMRIVHPFRSEALLTQR